MNVKGKDARKAFGNCVGHTFAHCWSCIQCTGQQHAAALSQVARENDISFSHNYASCPTATPFMVAQFDPWKGLIFMNNGSRIKSIHRPKREATWAHTYRFE